MKIAGINLPRPIAEALAECRAHFMAAAGFSLFTNLLLLAPAIYMLQVYDRALPTGGQATLLYLTIALAVALLALVGLDALRGRLLARASAQLERALAPRLLKHMFSSGEVGKSQMMRDFDSIRQVLGSPAAASLLDVPFIPIFILVCFLLSVWIGLLALVSVAGLLAIAAWNQRAIRPLTDAATQQLSIAYASEHGAVQQSGPVRALGMVGTLVQRQQLRRSGAIASSSLAQFAGARFTALSRFVRHFVQSAALGLGAYLAIIGEISAGGIIAGSILIGRALQPVDGLIGNWSSLTTARGALARLSDILSGDREAERDWTNLPAPKGRLALEQVAIASPDGRKLLDGASLKVDPGELVGVIGPSGSGKTTLARVAAGAVVPHEGIVRVDGADRADWDPDLLGRSIGFLPQEPSLLQGTITDNISRFDTFLHEDRSLTDERVVAAAKLAGVHELILKFPQGYDYEIGPMGAGLSAGQAQRIALARALYGNPAILILDEPNAFLDAEGEAALLNAINFVRKQGAAVLLVAHRKSVLQGADRLVVLENGQTTISGSVRDVAARLSGRTTEAVS